MHAETISGILLRHVFSGKRRKGRSRKQYIDNIEKWTRASLEENVRLTEDRTAWR